MRSSASSATVRSLASKYEYEQRRGVDRVAHGERSFLLTAPFLQLISAPGAAKQIGGGGLQRCGLRRQRLRQRSERVAAASELFEGVRPQQP